MNDDLDRLLRDTLDSAAQSYEPRGDGLTRIRARIDTRRARLRWLLPSVALAAVAAGVAGVLVLPTLLPSADPVRPQIAQPASPDATAEPSPPDPSATADPPSSTPVPDLVTVWPYASRREAAARTPGDVAAGRLPNLSDAKSTALHFVREFVRVSGPLEVVRTGPLGAGAGVTLGRRNPNGRLFDVTTVYLVRVTFGDDAPYVVVWAHAPGLQITDVSPGRAGTVTVTGKVTGVHQSVQARLLDKGGRTVAGAYDGAAGADRPWRAVLGGTSSAVPAGRYAVVAQTSSDADGFISELAVQPYTYP